MSDTQALARRLRDIRADLRSRIVAEDPKRIVFAATGRRVQDIIAHVACWEEAVAASLGAWREGREHTLGLPLDLDRQNEAFFERMHARAPEDVIAFWDEQRARLAEVVEQAPTVDTVFTCPWGGRESVARVADDMLEHEATHVAQILGPGAP